MISFLFALTCSIDHLSLVGCLFYTFDRVGGAISISVTKFLLYNCSVPKTDSRVPIYARIGTIYYIIYCITRVYHL